MTSIEFESGKSIVRGESRMRAANMTVPTEVPASNFRVGFARIFTLECPNEGKLEGKPESRGLCHPGLSG